ncbi:DUF7793 family protein [Flavobacterium psychrotolerans]|uniref:DUF7793 domain-containing protein n=1 Tax=Flavobacterium psychrotolerans TaxID=2169410 RepID=A0A2U1JH87_9FLAO|nr:hypothetical protein [Flavobacterium psychrotolerans]PWA04385.1 hypothetical protein DB895_11575 [Flavobacterium psychrotolerans]
MKIKKYPQVTFSKELDDDIIFLKFTESVIIDVKIAEDLIAKRIEFAENKDHYLIVNASKSTQGFTRGAKELFRHPEIGLKNILGAAFIVNNPVTVLLINILIKATPSISSKYFSNEKEALSWVKKLKESNKTG